MGANLYSILLAKGDYVQFDYTTRIKLQSFYEANQVNLGDPASKKAYYERWAMQVLDAQLGLGLMELYDPRGPAAITLSDQAIAKLDEYFARQLNEMTAAKAPPVTPTN